MPGYKVTYQKIRGGKVVSNASYCCTAATSSEAREKFKSHFRPTATEKYTILSVTNSSPR